MSEPNIIVRDDDHLREHLHDLQADLTQWRGFEDKYGWIGGLQDEIDNCRFLLGEDRP